MLITVITSSIWKNKTDHIQIPSIWADDESLFLVFIFFFSKFTGIFFILVFFSDFPERSSFCLSLSLFSSLLAYSLKENSCSSFILISGFHSLYFCVPCSVFPNYPQDFIWNFAVAFSPHIQRIHGGSFRVFYSFFFLIILSISVISKCVIL